MPSKYVLQQRGANGLENKAEIPALENGKIDMSWLPVVGESDSTIIAATVVWDLVIRMVSVDE